ncbi:MAG: hypothetical protein E5W44_00790 [Mesorhizobium sp.]|nr:MAG: hypothetical protein E5W44_00790 [Mesorhizobium sp.]
MNMHVVDSAFRFDVGAAVTHRSELMRATVTARFKTSRGQEIYTVRRLDECALPEIMLLGEVLCGA